MDSARFGIRRPTGCLTGVVRTPPSVHEGTFGTLSLTLVRAGKADAHFAPTVSSVATRVGSPVWAIGKWSLGPIGPEVERTTVDGVDAQRREGTAAGSARTLSHSECVAPSRNPLCSFVRSIAPPGLSYRVLGEAGGTAQGRSVIENKHSTDVE